MNESKEVLIVDLATPVYLPPYGTPLKWQREQGKLPGAIKRFVNHAAEPERYDAPTQHQLKLVIDYLRYYVGAPCWAGRVGSLDALRRQAEEMTTFDQARTFIHECLRHNLDPW